MESTSILLIACKGQATGISIQDLHSGPKVGIGKAFRWENVANRQDQIKIELLTWDAPRC